MLSSAHEITPKTQNGRRSGSIWQLCRDRSCIADQAAIDIWQNVEAVRPAIARVSIAGAAAYNRRRDQKTKEITLMEITDMESSLDRRMRILDEQIAREKAKREEEAVAAGTPAQQVTDGADLPTAPSNFDTIGTWPFPHR